MQLALDEPELSPRELATRFTDTKSYFVSEASVYRLLKEHDLIASPAYIVMKAADEFKDKTKGSNETQSEIAACNTKRTPHKLKTSDEPRPPLNHAAFCLKYSDDGHARYLRRHLR